MRVNGATATAKGGQIRTQANASRTRPLLRAARTWRARPFNTTMWHRLGLHRIAGLRRGFVAEVPAASVSRWELALPWGPRCHPGFQGGVARWWPPLVQSGCVVAFASAGYEWGERGHVMADPATGDGLVEGACEYDDKSGKVAGGPPRAQGGKAGGGDCAPWWVGADPALKASQDACGSAASTKWGTEDARAWAERGADAWREQSWAPGHGGADDAVANEGVTRSQHCRSAPSDAGDVRWQAKEWAGRSGEAHEHYAASGDARSSASNDRAIGGGGGAKRRSSGAPQDAGGAGDAGGARAGGAGVGLREISENQFRTLAGKRGAIDRTTPKGTFAFALLRREALRSLKRYREADVTRERLANYGCAVRDAEQLPGKGKAFVATFTGPGRTSTQGRGGAPTFVSMQQFIVGYAGIDGVLKWLHSYASDAGHACFPRADERPVDYPVSRERSPYVEKEARPCGAASEGQRAAHGASVGGKVEGLAAAELELAMQQQAACASVASATETTVGCHGGVVDPQNAASEGNAGQAFAARAVAEESVTKDRSAAEAEVSVAKDQTADEAEVSLARDRPAVYVGAADVAPISAGPPGALCEAASEQAVVAYAAHAVLAETCEVTPCSVAAAHGQQQRDARKRALQRLRAYRRYTLFATTITEVCSSWVDVLEASEGFAGSAALPDLARRRSKAWRNTGVHTTAVRHTAPASAPFPTTT